MEALFIILSLLLWIAFWGSIGITEGWKWRIDKKREDNNSLVTYDTYHVWRLVTNASVILLFVVAGLFNDIGLVRFVGSLVFSTVASWILYERVMTYVIWDDWLKKKEDFHILKYDFPRPHPYIEVGIGVASLIILAFFI